MQNLPLQTRARTAHAQWQLFHCQNAAPEKGPVSSLLLSQWAFLYLFFKILYVFLRDATFKAIVVDVETILFSYRGLIIGKLSQFEENRKSSLRMRHKEQKRLHKALHAPKLQQVNYVNSIDNWSQAACSPSLAYACRPVRSFCWDLAWISATSSLPTQRWFCQHPLPAARASHQLL